jgi:hypothetical protein
MAQTSNHYITRTGIKMHPGQYAAPRQDADAEAGVGRSYDPRSATRDMACLTRMWI